MRGCHQSQGSVSQRRLIPQLERDHVALRRYPVAQIEPELSHSRNPRNHREQAPVYDLRDRPVRCRPIGAKDTYLHTAQLLLIRNVADRVGVIRSRTGKIS